MTSLVKGTVNYCIAPNGNRKVIHFTLEDATNEKYRYQREHGVKAKVYQCKICKLWHITTRLSKKSKRRELI